MKKMQSKHDLPDTAAASEAAVEISNEKFFESVKDLIDEGMKVTFVVKGGSMYPFMRSGKDKVCIAPLAGRAVRKGDVVLFSYKGRYILHRIVGIRSAGGHGADCRQGALQYVAMGDGNLGNKEEFTRENIVGLAEQIITPSGKVIDLYSSEMRFYAGLWRILRPFRRYLTAVLRYIVRR